MIAKFIAAFFGVLVLMKSYDEFRRHREPLPVFLFWLVTWLAVLIVAFFPTLTDFFREKIFGPNTGLGTILGIAITFILFLSYRIYLKADRVERHLNHLISELALREFQEEVREAELGDRW